MKKGRPRRYSFDTPDGFTNMELGALAGALDELRERLYDVMSDLSDEIINAAPPSRGNSIGMLVLHMAAGEAGWIIRVLGGRVPADLQELLKPGMQDATGDIPPGCYSATGLKNICKRVRNEVTLPLLKAAESGDVSVNKDGRELTLRGVLYHQLWHWTYHGGQVGLLRRMMAERYQWTFDKTRKM